MEQHDHLPALGGQRIARGTSRLLASYGFVSLLEFVPTRGLRADVFALCEKGEIWVVECKSGLPDFTSDQKWHNYLEWCDRFLFAVDKDFPIEILPQEHGLIIADAYGGELLRQSTTEHKMSPARRKSLTLSFARQAAKRLQSHIDPSSALE